MRGYGIDRIMFHENIKEAHKQENKEQNFELQLILQIALIMLVEIVLFTIAANL